MWALTICSLILVTAVVVATVVLVRMATTISVQAVKKLADVMSETVERIIQPVVDPEPIRQIDVPEQTEMLNEPAWEKDWNP
jgi:hypothetical protein